jgi:hypothetical protein
MDDVDATLATLDEQERRGGRFRLIRRLTPYDRMLQAFLRRTVRPSALLLREQLELLTLESLRTADPDAAYTALEHIAEREAALAGDPDSSASYRVLYNLACVATQRTRLTRSLGKPADASYAGALAYLERALAVTTPSQRAHVQNWAMKDPSLEPVRQDDETTFRKALGLAAATH